MFINKFKKWQKLDKERGRVLRMYHCIRILSMNYLCSLDIKKIQKHIIKYCVCLKNTSFENKVKK